MSARFNFEPSVRPKSNPLDTGKSELSLNQFLEVKYEMQKSPTRT